MGREISNAFEGILDERPCNMVQSDKGTEFVNSTFQSMLSRRGIKFYTSENEDIKAAVAEIFNRTLNEKMYRYFTAKHTRRYVDVLQDLMTPTITRTIAPSQWHRQTLRPITKM